MAGGRALITALHPISGLAGLFMIHEQGSDDLSRKRALSIDIGAAQRIRRRSSCPGACNENHGTSLDLFLTACCTSLLR